MSPREPGNIARLMALYLSLWRGRKSSREPTIFKEKKPIDAFKKAVDYFPCIKKKKLSSL